MISFRIKLQKVIESLPLIFVIFFSMIYIIVMSYISIMKYLTFNDTVADLGVNNEVLWLLIHGGITNYNASKFSYVYPLQYEKPIIFLVAVLYYFFPGIDFLLILQSLVIGLAAIPLFYIGKQITRSAPTSSFIAISYLFFFPLTSANLFDFHFITFAPLAYFLMVLFWIRNKRFAAALSTFFLASINPLTLLMSIFFLIWIFFRELNKKIGNRQFSARANLKSFSSLIFLIIFLIFLLYIYYASGNLYLSSYIGSGSGEGSSLSVANKLLFNINGKLELFIYLFSSVAFLALLEMSTILLILPYLAYVFYTTGSANFAVFGLMYPIMAAGPIYFGVLLVLGKTRAKEDETNNKTYYFPTKKSKSDIFVYLSYKFNKLFTKQSTKMLIALGISTILFGIVYSPISPVNSYVSGGYFAGNHDTSALTTCTAEDQFLWKMISLVPKNASVITENDFPQLSGREHFETGFSHSAPWRYNFMFTSIGFNNFENQASFINLMNHNLANGSFGVYAEGMGGILLKENYHGMPVLFKPTNLNITPSSLLLGPYAKVNASTLVNTNTAYDFWFGPYINLLPGNYTATFYLSASNVSAKHIALLSLDVAVGSNVTVINSTEVYTNNFTSQNEIIAFSLNFTSARITTGVQLRGMFPTGVSQLTLYSIAIQQTSIL